jgi:ABC-type bacteriocin/lantibiotic exporter with double-glycine peptidase domain
VNTAMTEVVVMFAVTVFVITMFAVTMVFVIVHVHLAVHFMAMILVNVQYRPRSIRQSFKTDENVAKQYQDLDDSGHMLR